MSLFPDGERSHGARKREYERSQSGNRRLKNANAPPHHPRLPTKRRQQKGVKGVPPFKRRPYSSLPGFMIPFGSSAFLISRITRSSSGSLLCRKWSRFNCPMPCSALMLPP